MIITNPTTEQLHKLEKFISEHPNGNFFQSPSYYIFYKSLPNYEPIILISMDNNENITGSLIAVIQKEKGYLKSKLSSRCIVFGGPIVNNNSSDVADNLLKDLTKLVQSKSIYIEFRNLFDLTEYKTVFNKNEFEYKEHFNFVIEIKSPDHNLRLLDRNRRWQINKSLKTGVELIEAKNIDEIKEFFLLLNNLYKEKVKKPLPEFNFFEEFFLTSNLGKYFLVKFNNKIVGGSMCPIFKKTVYEWYKVSLDKQYKHIYPGVLATWAPITYAARNGFNYFDFLGAGSIDDNYGVREFKSKFGGKLVQYGRFLRVNNKMLYNVGKFGLKILGVINQTVNRESVQA